MQHVAFLDQVFLALQPQPAGVAGARFAAVADEIVVRDGLGADEALLEVGVDHAGRLRGGVALVDGPGARFLGADREIGLQAQQVIGLADQLVQAGLGEFEGLQELSALGARQRRNLGFDLG